MIGYPTNALFEEVAVIAYHFHWPYDEIMRLDHVERRRWVEEIGIVQMRFEDGSR